MRLAQSYKPCFRRFPLVGMSTSETSQNSPPWPPPGEGPRPKASINRVPLSYEAQLTQAWTRFTNHDPSHPALIPPLCEFKPPLSLCLSARLAPPERGGRPEGAQLSPSLSLSLLFLLLHSEGTPPEERAPAPDVPYELSGASQLHSPNTTQS